MAHFQNMVASVIPSPASTQSYQPVTEPGLGRGIDEEHHHHHANVGGLKTGKEAEVRATSVTEKEHSRYIAMNQQQAVTGPILP